MSTTSSKYQLSSMVIRPSAEGNYPFHVKAFLLAHEMMRRELDLGEAALDSFQPEKYRWEIKAFNEWLTVFFLPIVRAHHENEDTYAVPFYTALGVVTPERHFDDHTTLEGRINKVSSLSRYLVSRLTLDGVIESSKVAELKVEFSSLSRHMREHFSEEEIYWPPIVKRYGESNWKRVEWMIYNHDKKFVEYNKGSGYCLAAVAMAFAMGMDVPNVVREPHEKGWASESIQNDFSSMVFSPIVRYTVLPTWGKRYNQARLLIKSVAEHKLLLPERRRKGGGGIYIDGVPKSPLMVTLYLFLLGGLFFSLIVGPLFGSAKSPIDNVHNLNIYVTDFDGGFVGSAFVSFLKTVQAQAGGLPFLDFQYNPNNTTPTQLQDMVLDSKAWASVYITSGASKRLLAASATGCTDATRSALYKAEDAIQFVWDEGRNSAVAVPFVKGAFSTVVPLFTNYFAAKYMKLVGTAATSSCLTNGFQSILINPVGVTYTNLTPTSVSYVASTLFSIGHIYIAIFGALVIVDLAYKKSAAHVENMKPMQRILFRCFMFAVLGLGIALALSTIVVLTTYHGSSGHLFSGMVWAQIFGVTWLHIMIWSFVTATETETLDEDLIPALFPLLMMSSVIGGTNTDLAYQSYKDFYQIFPFTWSINIYRYILFGSRRSYLTISSCILVAYFIFFVCTYIYVAKRNEDYRISEAHIVEVDDGDHTVYVVDHADEEISAPVSLSHKTVKYGVVSPTNEIALEDMP